MADDAEDEDLEEDDEESETPDGYEVARITIIKYITDDDVRIQTDWEGDGPGSEMPLVDGLGMLAVAQLHLADGYRDLTD